MNIRLSADSVRMRVSLEEAHILEFKKHIAQSLPLAEGEVVMEVLLVREQDSSAKFSFNGKNACAYLRESEFFEILKDKPSRESCIKTALSSNGKESVEFIFEIDLFSRKGRRLSSK